MECMHGAGMASTLRQVETPRMAEEETLGKETILSETLSRLHGFEVVNQLVMMIGGVRVEGRPEPGWEATMRPLRWPK